MTFFSISKIKFKQKTFFSLEKIRVPKVMHVWLKRNSTNLFFILSLLQMPFLISRPSRVKMGDDFLQKWKNQSSRLGRFKNRNEARKKIWAAEIELYLLTMANGLSGIRKMWKMVSMFSKFVSSIRRHVVDNLIWDICESQMALKIKISHSKNNFESEILSKI